MQDLISMIRALQANFDHLMGVLRNIGSAHNLVVDDIDEIVEQLEGVNLEVDSKLDIADAVTTHDDLTGVTSGQHHAQSHNQSDHTGTGATSTQAMGDAPSDGTGTKPANIDHKHGMPSGAAPTGAAGGDLSGTYPNPAVVDDSHAHTSATVTTHSTAHAASAVTADSTTLVGVGTDVQAVLEELDNGIADHLADTTDAHDASAISIVDSGAYFTGTDVEAALQELGAGGGGGGAPSGPAGGDLSGTYPNPSVTDDSHAHTSTTVTTHSTAHAHSATTGQTADDHHAKSHAHNGADGSGTVAGSDLTGTPGGELGGTWASPTVDATHSGSAHHTQSHDHASAGDGTSLSPATLVIPASTTPAQTAEGSAVWDSDDDKLTVGTGAARKTLVNDDDSRLTDSRAPNGSAGGDLSGTYPNPSVVDDSHAHSSASVTTHSTAHAASAITADSTTLVGVGTDVQAVLEELDNGIADHLADAADAHDASAISVLDSAAQITATDVEGALAEIVDASQAHEAAADPHTGYRLESADHTHASTGAQAGQLDHGTALTGLSDDDHPQYVLEATADVSGTLALSGDISPAQLTADQNDWSPAGLASASVIRVDIDANNRIITGITGGSDGRVLVLHNISNFVLNLAHENAGSVAANRFVLPSSLAANIGGGGSYLLVYDGTSSRWRGFELGISTTTPVAIASAGSAGTATFAGVSRGNHTHGHGTGYLPDAHHNQAHDNADHTNRTRYIWVGPGDWLYDDATAGSTGTTTPHLFGFALFNEASGRTGIYFSFLVPEDYVAASTMSITLVWFSTAAAGNVVWTVQVDSLASGQNALGPPTNLLSGGAAGQAFAEATTVQYSTFTSTFTPAAAGDVVGVNLERNASHANDTSTGNARLIGVRLAYTADM